MKMSEEEDKYKEKLHVLESKCEAIQRENEEIASQVIKTKRNLCKARRLRMRLLQKLDEIGDLDKVKGISLKAQRSTNFKLGLSSSLQGSNQMPMLPMPESPPSFGEHDLLNEGITNGM